MRNADLYKGISAEKQAEYEKWLIDRYGGDMPDRIATSRKKFDALTDAEKARLNEDLADIETAWAEAMKKGIAADASSLDPLVGRFAEWVGFMWGRPCPPDALAGLADMHLSHPDFVARYEAIAEGFSDYHAASMKAYAARLGG